MFITIFHLARQALPDPDGQIYAHNRRGVVPARFLFPPGDAWASFILQSSYIQEVHCPVSWSSSDYL